MARVLCLDFDDTIVMENTARLVFERFAAPAWRDREADYRAGRLTVEQFNAIAEDAKANCPVSRALNATITLHAKLETCREQRPA